MMALQLRISDVTVRAKEDVCRTSFRVSVREDGEHLGTWYFSKPIENLADAYDWAQQRAGLLREIAELGWCDNKGAEAE